MKLLAHEDTENANADDDSDDDDLMPGAKYITSVRTAAADSKVGVSSPRSIWKNTALTSRFFFCCSGHMLIRSGNAVGKH